MLFAQEQSQPLAVTSDLMLLAVVALRLPPSPRPLFPRTWGRLPQPAGELLPVVAGRWCSRAPRARRTTPPTTSGPGARLTTSSRSASGLQYRNPRPSLD